MEIVMGLIRQGNKYNLQLRNGKQQAGGLNLIGCFGGQIEAGETSKATVCREVAEECTLKPKQKDLQYLGAVDVKSERHGVAITVHAVIYIIEIPKNEEVKALEGELITMTDSEIRGSLDKLTPATRACFEQLL